MVGVPTTWRAVVKGRTIRKGENPCSTARSQQLFFLYCPVPASKMSQVFKPLHVTASKRGDGNRRGRCSSWWGPDWGLLGKDGAVQVYTHPRQQNTDFCSGAGEEETVECFWNTGSMHRLGSLYFYQGPLQKEDSADRSSSRLWQLLMLKGRDLKWHTENGAAVGIWM